MAPECASPVLLAAVNDYNDNINDNDNDYNAAGSAVEFAPYDCCLDDIWSVGILVLNILTAKNPWEVADPAVDANYATYLTVNRADSLANTFGLTPETARVVAGLLHPNPARRWSLSRARRHVASISTFIAPPPSPPPPAPVAVHVAPVVVHVAPVAPVAVPRPHRAAMPHINTTDARLVHHRTAADLPLDTPTMDYVDAQSPVAPPPPRKRADSGYDSPTLVQVASQYRFF
ncbi:hypothetical protein BC831DRAFT_458667 [Entophlyctis helioformis]|nr:hypothetical protein BC831DRAFT_458667 [Entophlyctis helioformis]